MSNPLFDMSPYQSETARNYSLDWKDATGTDPAWDEPSLEPDLGANSQEVDGDAPSEWRSAAEFTLTLASGQTLNCKFIPGLDGELSMHQFDFSGPVSTTGFKSHFVLAVEAEEFPHPSDYAQVYASKLVAQLEEDLHQSKRTERTHRIAEAQVLHGQKADNDDSTVDPAMTENETADSSHASVEVVEELSPEEAADRQRLELKVERSFYESAAALRELRDKRLYRSTHRTFEQYCQDRFSFSRISAYNKITAAEVMDNLLSNALQDGEIANPQPTLPNSERQCKELAKLPKQQQSQAWLEAVARTPGNRVPAASTLKAVVLEMKGVVDRLKQKNPPPPEFALGDVVEIKATSHSPLRPFARMWGIIEHVGSFSYTVRLGIARDTQQCKGEEMVKIDDEYTADIKVVSQRIAALVQFELEPVEYAILEVLQRAQCFTPTQLELLEWLEHKHLAA